VAITTIGAVEAWDGTYIQIDNLAGGAEYEVDADSVIIYVDSKNCVGVEGGKIVLASEEQGSKINNVYVIGNSDNEIEVLFVDVNNEWQ